MNVVSNLEDTVGNDNHVLFANLADIQTQNTAIKILASTLAGTIASADADNDLNAFYQAAGISSSLWPGAVSDEALMGVELLVVMLPDDAFTVSELTAMAGFLAGGCRILFMGEQHGFAATQNGYLNAALAFVGSAMSLGTSSIDTSGCRIRSRVRSSSIPSTPASPCSITETSIRSPASRPEGASKASSSSPMI